MEHVNKISEKTQDSLKLAILIVAYNHAATLAKVLDRIPKSVKDAVSEIVVFDDASQDETYLVGHGYRVTQGIENLNIIRNEVNLGYGGNQKKGYFYCIEKGYDIVVLLHGDGQYAPEVLPELLAPLIENKAQAVFGSRMLVSGQALRGGMPYYKYMGNKILTVMENRLLGTTMSEFHSGYRLYNLHALRQIPIMNNSNDFHFDTEIIIQFLEKGFKILELPIPTYYGDEICYVNGMKYAKNVIRSVVEYKLWQKGLREDPRFEVHSGQRYPFKDEPFSSHRRIVDLCSYGSRVLDLACGSGELDKLLAEKGCRVTGVDLPGSSHAGKWCEEYIAGDLNRGIPEGILEKEKTFDVIIAGDIIEHLTSPKVFLRQARESLTAEGFLIASTGNIAHWSVRLGLFFGLFDYAPRGILDTTHVHLYTLSSFRKLLKLSGYQVKKVFSTPTPFGQIFSGKKSKWLTYILDFASYFLALLWRRLFSYQFILVAGADPKYEALKEFDSKRTKDI